MPSTAEDPSARRERYVAELGVTLAADPRVRAAWLEGSLGRGNADRFSDIDLHVLLHERDFATFGAEAEDWLNGVRPLVLFNRLFGGHMINALTHDALRLDLWPHRGESVGLDPVAVRVLHETPGSLRWESGGPPPDGVALARRGLAQAREFWRCLTLLPAVIGRDERLVALNGLLVEVGLVCDLLMLGAGTVRDRGVKNLNAFLSPEDRQHLEALVTLGDLSPRTLIRAHLALARLVRAHGPHLARRAGEPYPQALEDTALNYVRSELTALGYPVSALEG
ncbi:hypothetical protein DAETH_30610 [Deinococcus aetherius]|uniref:Polymerase nucleotidyl transferase domain-containing protein n=2 Tax=Deinococcus aetherius TaxID=200252 RepID=A0ABM8AHD0_9DEIO|nr:hypothetical protein DAETH_30610 [Deinococcus aetherius]